MPLYEYQCHACGRRFEVIQKFSDPPAAACTSCGKGPVERLLSSPAIQFKGSGWYITDYAQKGKSKGEAGGEGKKSDDKPAAAGADSGTTGKSETTAAPAKPAAAGKE